MKKTVKVLSLSALAVLGVASLASCKEKKKTTLTKDDHLDVVVNYDKKAGISSVQSSPFTAVNGKTYANGALLPTWEAFEEKLDIDIKEASDYSQKTKPEFAALSNQDWKSDKTGETVDLIMGGDISTAAEAGKLYSVSTLLEYGYMPNFKKWLKANDSTGDLVAQMAATDGDLYYTPYFDGLNDVEKYFLFDVSYVEKLLDGDLGSETGTVLATTAYQPYIASMTNQKITVTNAAATGKTDITVSYTADKNVIKQQDALTSKTGLALTQTLRNYIDEVYGDYIGTGKIYSKRSEIFTSASACYNADELVALLRCVKTMGKLLTGQDKEVVPFVTRTGQADRAQQAAMLGTIFGVRGLMTGESGNLFFDKDGKLTDGRTQQATYDALLKLNTMYQEGLIQQNFHLGYGGTRGTEWRSSLMKTGQAFMLYDYATTTANYNADCKAGYVNNMQPALPPVAKWDAGDKTQNTYFHFTDDNRALKSGGWCIPANSDNVEQAALLMDYLFSEEGANIQDYGPEDGGFRDGTMESPSGDTWVKVSDAVKNDMVAKGKSWNDYYRMYVGSTHGIGHQRSVGLDYQCNLSESSHNGWDVVSTAVKCGALIAATTTASNKFYRSVPSNYALTTTESDAITASADYTLINNVWSYSDKDADVPAYIYIIEGGWSNANLNGLTEAQVQAAFAGCNSVYQSVYRAAYTRSLNN